VAHGSSRAAFEPRSKVSCDLPGVRPRTIPPYPPIEALSSTAQAKPENYRWSSAHHRKYPDVAHGSSRAAFEPCSKVSCDLPGVPTPNNTPHRSPIFHRPGQARRLPMVQRPPQI